MSNVAYAKTAIHPRGLSRVEAARYIGISPSTFDKLVKDRRMPEPKRINARAIWDLHELDLAFAALPGGDAEHADSWGDVA